MPKEQGRQGRPHLRKYECQATDFYVQTLRWYEFLHRFGLTSGHQFLTSDLVVWGPLRASQLGGKAGCGVT